VEIAVTIISKATITNSEKTGKVDQELKVQEQIAQKDLRKENSFSEPIFNSVKKIVIGHFS